jgi:hypothetical protein
MCSPCASHLQVPCSASRVVPGAHRVVGLGTHRGSGPREVHTTVLDTADRLQALTPEAGQNILASDVVGPLEPVAEEGRGENEVIQPVNPTANAAANPPASAAANDAGNVANNTANAAGTQPNITANPRQNVGAQPPPAQANHAKGPKHHSCGLTISQ